MKVAMRQITGAFSQLEKARLVAKLKAARDRKREARLPRSWPLKANVTRTGRMSPRPDGGLSGGLSRPVEH